MNIRMRARIGAVVVAISAIASPLQAQVATTTPLSVPFYGIPDEMTSCFDYYTYGSVEATLVPMLETVSAGSLLPVRATVKNNNAQPIVDAQLLVRVARNTGDEKDVAGPDIIEDIVPISGMVLKAGEEKTYEFSWKVPVALASDEYVLLPYIQNAGHFNLQGLSFTTDVTGDVAPFTVEGEVDGSVRFDTSSVTVAGESYQMIGIPPLIPPQTQGVPITVTLKNDTDQPAEGTIEWTLYTWDGLDEKRIIDRRTDDVAMHPRRTEEFTFTARDTGHSIYYLRGVMNASGHRSEIGIRFTRMYGEDARINDLGVTAYPLTDTATAYICMHELLEGMTVPDVRSEATVDLIVARRGSAGTDVIASKTYTGKLSQELAALALPLSSLTEELTDFELIGRIKFGDTVIDEVTLTYACETLGGTCPEPRATTSMPTTDDRQHLVWLLVGLVGIFMAVVILAFFYYLRPRQ